MLPKVTALTPVAVKSASIAGARPNLAQSVDEGVSGLLQQPGVSYGFERGSIADGHERPDQ
jgi:hypothetical protein